MKKMINLFIAVMMLSLLSGCLGMNVYTETNSFYAPKYKNEGTITVFAAENEVNVSQDFVNYKQQFEQKLASSGYTIASNPAEAQYIAFVAYGMDNGKSSVVSTPVFFTTNDKIVYSIVADYKSTGNFKNSGPSYTMPKYDIADSSATPAAEYTRAIAMDIVDAESLRTGTAKIVYRTRTKSTGTCNRISGVFAEMIEAMFAGFPGER